MRKFSYLSWRMLCRSVMMVCRCSRICLSSSLSMFSGVRAVSWSRDFICIMVAIGNILWTTCLIGVMDDLISGISAALVVGLFASSNMFCRRCKCSLSASFTFLMISSAASSSSSAKAVSRRNCSGMTVLSFWSDVFFKTNFSGGQCQIQKKICTFAKKLLAT